MTKNMDLEGHDGRKREWGMIIIGRGMTLNHPLLV
jgi:hypothetical protein